MQKTLTLIIIIIISGINYKTLSQNYLFSGRVPHDTTWKADTIFITNHVKIDSGVLLTIMPGTVLVFDGYYHITSYGNIKAQGVFNDSIVFLKINLHNLNDASTYEGGWNGIRLMPRSLQDTTVFNYCRFQGGKAINPFTPFNDESDEAKGGLLFCKDCGNVQITNCKFTRSFAKRDGAGIYIYKANNVIIRNNEFTYNYAQFKGGGIFSDLVYNMIIENNVFYKNTSFFENYDIGGEIAGQGSAINIWNAYNHNAKCLIKNNYFSNNFSPFGTVVESYWKTRIENNIICNNHGVSIVNGNSSSIPLYIGNTIMNNLNYFYVSGILYMSPGIKIINNIIWHNYTDYPDDPQVFSLQNKPIDIRYSNIMYGFEGEGNINEVPLFVRPTIAVGDYIDGLDADWSLMDESPCVNTGIADTTGLHLSPIDLLGNPRVFGGRIDMGAIENQHVLQNEPALVATQLQVYPNPGYDRLFVVVPVGFESGTFELFDAQGVCVFSQQVGEGPAVFSPNRATPGIYFYRLRQNDLVVAQGKWIKSN
ncbi:MAG: right-handed parallel beta-helix repeat-containing protein [Bacteroidetes bacterium]|nr:right-handed parallel beta-helix repeat-containing protein [Bacteroidota bacterium]